MKIAVTMQASSIYFKKHQIFAIVSAMMVLCYPVSWAWAAGAFSIYHIWPLLFLLTAVFATFQASKEPPFVKWFAVSSFQLAWIVAFYLIFAISFCWGWSVPSFRPTGLAYLIEMTIYAAYLTTLPGVISLFPRCWTIAVPSWLLGLWFFHWVAN